jgi:glycosyltransferase involved in cell wall biosynthesis
VIYADQRWIGNHGIGRFAKRVLEGVDFRTVPLASHPADPLDALHLSWALKNLGAHDLFFSPGYNTPLFCRAPFVFTIHDLGHIQCPENREVAISVYYATMMKRACVRAQRILTVSEFTRQQIIDWSGVAAEKVVNVGCGVDPAYQPRGDSYGVPFAYLLSVSNRRPHKNEERLVEAFAKASLDPQIHLVFTGHETTRLRRWIEAQHVSSRVDFVGTVPEEKLPALYRGAQALVLPSLYEGFGLPVLEAMACGVPVVTSSVTAMPEVAGDAALFVDPRSVDEISLAMEKLMGDTELRRQLIEKGTERAALFTWASTAARVRELLQMQAGLM